MMSPTFWAEVHRPVFPSSLPHTTMKLNWWHAHSCLRKSVHLSVNPFKVKGWEWNICLYFRTTYWNNGIIWWIILHSIEVEFNVGLLRACILQKKTIQNGGPNLKIPLQQLFFKSIQKLHLETSQVSHSHRINLSPDRLASPCSFHKIRKFII